LGKDGGGGLRVQRGGSLRFCSEKGGGGGAKKVLNTRSHDPICYQYIPPDLT